MSQTQDLILPSVVAVFFFFFNTGIAAYIFSSGKKEFPHYPILWIVQY